MADLKADAQLAGTREEYLRIHRFMALTKALDDRMHILVKQGRAPFVGSARGHEGVQVGATAALDGPDDWLVPHYRGLGSVVTMGLTAREWMLAVFAKASDPLTAGRNIPGGCFGYRQKRVVTVSQAAAREAVARARAGEGPTLIEGLIKRINSHTSEDNQARYRTADEIAEALAYDPVVKFENWLAERGWLSTSEAERIRLELEREAGEAADWAEQQPDPRAEDTLRNVYSEGC